MVVYELISNIGIIIIYPTLIRIFHYSFYIPHVISIITIIITILFGIRIKNIPIRIISIIIFIIITVYSFMIGGLFAGEAM